MQLNIRGPGNSLLSFGHITLNLLKYLDRIGHHVSFWPIGQIQPTFPVPFIQKLINNQANWDYKSPSLLIWHEFSAAETIFSSLHSLLTFFEINKFDERRKHHLNSCDLIFVASQWAKDILINNEIKKPTEVINIGVDREIFNENIPPAIANPTNSTRFFFCGKFEIRKAVPELKEAFNKAFSTTDNVELLISAYNPFLSREENNTWENFFKESPLGEKIQFIGPVQTDLELASIINSCDCTCIPSKGEAVCLPLLQSISCGRQIISTEYSGMLEFLDEHNSFLLEPTGFESAIDGRFFDGSAEWATFNIDQLIEYMREIYKMKREGKNMLNQQGIDTASELTWTNTCNQLVRTLEKHGVHNA